VVHGMKMYCDEEITSTINEGTMQYAVNLTEYFRCTAKKVYRKIFANSGKEEVTKKDIIKFLHESGKTQSEIARFLECSQPYVNKVLKI
jgi:predicted transcriptional regulator